MIAGETMTDKIIFLDIDGVLCTRQAVGWARRNHQRPAFAHHRQPMPQRSIDVACVKRLNEVCAKTGAIIVVSSQWRIDRNVRGILTQRARFIGRFHADWRTDSDGPTRGDEIQRWIDRHPCSAFAVLDDKPQVLDSQRGRLVLTDGYSGLQWPQADQLMKLLA